MVGFPAAISLSEHIFWHELGMEDKSWLLFQSQLLLGLS